MSKLPDAAEFMRRAHDAAGQKRKDGRPYWTHPLAVFDVLALELGVADEDALAAALLHDVVEDTPTPLAEIEARFGEGVARMVGLLSKPPAPADQKPAMLAAYYAGLRGSAEVVRQIKLADRVHNLRDMRDTPRAFQERYLPDTRDLMAVLAGTPGAGLLRAEYARAQSHFLHKLLEEAFG